MDNPFDTPPPRCEGCNPALMIFPETFAMLANSDAETTGRILKPVFQWLTGCAVDVSKNPLENGLTSTIAARHIAASGKYVTQWKRNHNGGIGRAKLARTPFESIPIEDVETVCDDLGIDTKYAEIFADKMEASGGTFENSRGQNIKVTALNLRRTIEAFYKRENTAELERRGLVV